MKKDFENFLHEYFCENNPEILDDMLPDCATDWIADLDCEEFIRLGDLYAKSLLNEGSVAEEDGVSHNEWEEYVHHREQSNEGKEGYVTK